MDTPLSSCTIIERRAVIRFLWAEGVRSADTHRRMLAQYSSVDFVSPRKVYIWVARFKSGRTSVSDKARLGHLSTSHTQHHINRANALIREDEEIAVSEVAEMLDTSSGCAYTILYDNLGYWKVCQMGL
jgi:hypothetical protein